MTKTKRIGSRAEVMHGHAMHTSGGLTSKDLVYNKSRTRIVSRKKQRLGKSAANKKRFIIPFAHNRFTKSKKSRRRKSK